MANGIPQLKDNIVRLTFESGKNWQVEPHVMANGEPCPEPHWLLWGGIGATCRYCGRIEIDGELSGFESTGANG